ncbi:MAG: DEAD/DEAH box helicase [Acidimicrobiaceae bacterium]|nr:DEAD/DEAH box helicase [Acidimicrobiaceae bacterium]MYE96116.1 DEAD/DEAH box helicase [Acidimicrobiaceae bacterium]MYI55326.1 DEAD/DEAH box helicase [Acidimicrobiaceae bacterium]MYJ81743.1 DEAD/DEAH box helicase [Acidimicrobiaceae bacterium]
MSPLTGWAGPHEELGRYIAEESQRTLDSYRAQPNLVTEHANLEADTASGGYQHRQLYELVQNGADALAPASSASDGACSPRAPRGGRIEVRLADDCLYCADDGGPIDEDGVRALMFSHMSPKRATSQIGTFGLGFKSLLGVSDSPEFLSRSGSFRFDRNRSDERISQVVPDVPLYPVLRIADPIDPAECLDDEAGRELMSWASNIIRLALKPGAYEDLHAQMKAFPAEFLLFVKHVRRLRITDGSRVLDRGLELSELDDEWRLRDDGTESAWKLFDKQVQLSPDAAADRRHGESQDDVKLWWAAPLERLDQPGTFWTYFPTETQSLVAGILNAPWKTNVDRQNLLTGPFNEELIHAAAKLIADALPQLATGADPARHLDALPRRHQAGDSLHADRLRHHLYSTIHGRAILPNQDGRLKRANEIAYAPSLLASNPRQTAEALDLWASHDARPTNWLHHKALTRNRIARVNALFESDPETPYREAPRATARAWLEALVQAPRSPEQVQASSVAVRVAALLDISRLGPGDLGNIVLTANGAWRLPDPASLFLPYESPTVGSTIDPRSCVHPTLAADSHALAALRKLGLREQTAETGFRMLADRALRLGHSPSDEDWRTFWVASRRLEVQEALGAIRGPPNRARAGRLGRIRVLTRSGAWAAPHSVLRPDSIVPEDGSRDNDATVDMGFHGPDEALLEHLGVVKQPRGGRDLSIEPSYDRHEDECEQHYRSRDDLPYTPRQGYLSFMSSRGLGPLNVLTTLSDEGRALYTDALLSHDDCYAPLTMWHTGSNREWYPEQDCESLAVRMIRELGRIGTADGIVAFADALGDPPRNTDALLCLLRHSNADRIKSAFGLADPAPEFFGVHDPVPLIDVWPGLQDYTRGNIESLQLVRCERIRVGHEDRVCLLDGDDVYLAAATDEDRLSGLRQVVQALHLDLSESVMEDIASGTTPSEVEERRARVRQHTTDAGRLLAAVGERGLRAGLPPSLLEALEADGREQLTGTDIAEAAIATYHTDALRQFRHRLGPLKPPSKWAGSARAVDFVRSLGFAEEWAGERSRPRPPFEVVDGPWELPDLHDYQRTVVENVRRLMQAEHSETGSRRGMISMPTGSGKTRVAVQAIVEAIRDDGFDGGVLWIADRDELCEQAVEAWRQVWASIGSRTTRLRISRMWRGQPRPLQTRKLHVVVASIQTAYSRLSSPGYDFLKGFRLVVFDEAHRSIAPTSTNVFGELGLTFRTRQEEPFLLGLTATPYRGHDERETARLVNRYGSNRLDAGAFSSDDPQAVIEELQRTRVLALADHELIDGATFELSADELSQMQRFTRGEGASGATPSVGWLPRAAEERIARDAERTQRIVDAFDVHIKPGWPTLVFATSVEHAQTVSALLNRKGITARAVSGETEHATRRRVVEQFREGKIQALVNYAVFREGFDAPRTRAIIVARPVYSPNLYFQMVGRGLRGPKNGGNCRCLILNVRDNIENFHRALAFSELDWLWTG